MPAVMTTEISPSVSRPRKSTRMTLTMLWPWATAALFSAKNSLSRRRNWPCTTRSSTASTPTPPAIARPPSRSRSSSGRGSLGGELQPGHHQGEDHHRQDLDHELGEAEVGRAEQQEDQRHREALNAERDDRRTAASAQQTTVTTPSDRQRHRAPFVEGERPNGGRAGQPPSVAIGSSRARISAAKTTTM